MAKQRTFGALTGIDPVVPTRRHPDDLVECSDGTVRCHGDVCYDCRGGAHGSEDDRLEAEVTIVSEVLNGVGKWADEYCTENSDYADGYAHMVDELSHDWPERVKEWICDTYGDSYGYTRFDGCIDKLVSSICEALGGGFDTEAEYDRNEYAGYSGKGCCLASFDIGEHEEQIDVSAHDDLNTLHEEGRLDDILDRVNCDVYVSRHQRREKNETTGRYENVGRETYNPYNRDNPTFEVYTNPGGQWRFVVPAERMKELFVDALADYCKRVDGKD